MSDRIIVQCADHASEHLALFQLPGGRISATMRNGETVLQVVLDEGELAHELDCLDGWTVAVERPASLTVNAPRWKNGEFIGRAPAIVLQWLVPDDAVGVRFLSDGHESGVFLHELATEEVQQIKTATL